MKNEKDPYTRIREAVAQLASDHPTMRDHAALAVVLGAVAELEGHAPLNVLATLLAWNRVPAASRSLVAGFFMRNAATEQAASVDAALAVGHALPVRRAVFLRARDAFSAFGMLSLELAQIADGSLPHEYVAHFLPVGEEP